MLHLANDKSLTFEFKEDDFTISKEVYKAKENEMEQEINIQDIVHSSLQPEEEEIQIEKDKITIEAQA